MKAVTDASGAVVHQADYYAFGTQFDKSGSFDEDHGFNGKEYDEDIGIYYYNARWYDPELGRFISEDPAMDPNNPNLYSYCGNNPTGRIDPDGQFWHILAKFVISAVVHWVYNAASDAAQQDGSFWYNFTHNLWHNPRTSVSGYVDSQGKVQCGERPEATGSIDTSFDYDYNCYSTGNIDGLDFETGSSEYRELCGAGWFQEGVENCSDDCPLTPYASADDAAKDFARHYFDDTGRNGKEYGSTIYEVNVLQVYGNKKQAVTINGKKYKINNGQIMLGNRTYPKYYFYTVPNYGAEDNVLWSVSNQRNLYKVFGIIHSHLCGDDWSNADIKIQKYRHTTDYLVNMAGDIYRRQWYEPWDNDSINSNGTKIFTVTLRDTNNVNDPSHSDFLDIIFRPRDKNNQYLY